MLHSQFRLEFQGDPETKEESVGVVPAPAPEGDEEGGGAPAPAGPGPDDSLAPLLARLHEILGEGIERIVAIGGGLVVVADGLDPESEERVASVQGEVPVALVDARSWAALSSLGPLSPWSGDRVLFETPVPGRGPVSPPPAIRKLRAAETLAGSGQGPEALNLAAASMLLSVAGAAEETPPPLERAAVWLHGDMVPRGFLASEQAAAISRALALAGAADVPPELVEEVLADARALVETFV